MTFAEAQQTLGKRDSRKLENNTYLHRLSDEAVAIQLHGTNVVTLYANGSVKLNSGGWHTVTTKDRINGYAPNILVHQKKFAWYVHTRGQKLAFEDGMVIDPQ